MVDAARLSDSTGIKFKIDKPREGYLHGWGDRDKCTNATMIRCTWHVTVMDTKKEPVTLSFDLVGGSSPLIVGIDMR